MEMLTVYNTFARMGERIYPTAIQRVEDTRGHEVALERPQPEREFDAYNVSQLVSMLIDVVETGTGKSARVEGRVVAGKTGTTDRVVDIWFAGFTPDISTVVWMGNEHNQPLRGVFSFNAAQVFHDYTTAYYQAHPLPSRGFDLVDAPGGQPKKTKAAVAPSPIKPLENANAETSPAAPQSPVLLEDQHRPSDPSPSPSSPTSPPPPPVPMAPVN
jgi:membrane peptidoglycan carboxypeptidase